MAERHGDGRWRATRVMRAAQPLRKAKAPARKFAKTGDPYATGYDLMRVALVLAYACVLGWAIRGERLPLEFAFAPVLMSIVTFMAYALDKDAAQKGRWRIPEANLHLLELAFGWPGALLSQRVLRHKISKQDYLLGFWIMVVVNVGATIGWIYWKS